MASVKAHEHMDENLSNVDAGVEDLVGGGKIEAEKTFDFGPTLTTKGRRQRCRTAAPTAARSPSRPWPQPAPAPAPASAPAPAVPDARDPSPLAPPRRAECRPSRARRAPPLRRAPPRPSRLAASAARIGAPSGDFSRDTAPAPSAS
ncbi:uncharacterized protein [Miscanthus floridulus]|uniref:uncharacterized protein n=1 Tax=Miscanthus floridulus TaxID=154761 RepID=UPI003458F5EB